MEELKKRIEKQENGYNYVIKGRSVNIYKEFYIRKSDTTWRVKIDGELRIFSSSTRKGALALAEKIIDGKGLMEIMYG